MLIALTVTSGLRNEPDIKIIISEAHHSDSIIMFGMPNFKNGIHSCMHRWDQVKLVSFSTVDIVNKYIKRNMTSRVFVVLTANAAPKYPKLRTNIYK